MSDEPRFAIEIPDTQRPGVFADFVSIWHTDDSFVLDFTALVQPLMPVEDGGEGFVQGQAQVVSRVRIAPGQVFEIMKALEQQLSLWEAARSEPSQQPPTG